MGNEKFQIFSPQNFEDYVGQNRAKRLAQVMISAAAIENRNLPNILIEGPYGTGKTSLARLIYKQANIEYRFMDASSVKQMPIVKYPLLIDEVHNLDPVVADSLNIVLDRGNAQIIACTTSPGHVPAAFKSRFREIHLEPYNLDEIEQILTLALVRKQFLLDPFIVKEIARRSRLNPRAAVQNMAFIFDWMLVNSTSNPSANELENVFDILGIDKNGLTERDYKYLRALDTDHSVGLSHLSAILGVDNKTIEREIEPYLLQLGLIGRMPRGRVLLRDL